MQENQAVQVGNGILQHQQPTLQQDIFMKRGLYPQANQAQQT